MPAALTSLIEASNQAPVHASGSVLIVDDEPMVREVLGTYLRHEGYTVTEVDSGTAALTALDGIAFDLVMLDLMLPGVNGVEVLRHLRSTADTPVILLSALGDEAHRIGGLEAGADDYVVKPFSPREVAARVRSVLRRSTSSRADVVCFDDVEIDLRARSVRRAGQPIELTKREFELLAHLVNHEGEALSRERLLAAVWGSSPDWQDPATVTVHIGRLRRKLESELGQARHLVTVFGVGYRFER